MTQIIPRKPKERPQFQILPKSRYARPPGGELLSIPVRRRSRILMQGSNKKAFGQVLGWLPFPDAQIKASLNSRFQKILKPPCHDHLI